MCSWAPKTFSADSRQFRNLPLLSKMAFTAFDSIRGIGPA